MHAWIVFINHLNTFLSAVKQTSPIDQSINQSIISTKPKPSITNFQCSILEMVCTTKKKKKIIKKKKKKKKKINKKLLIFFFNLFYLFIFFFKKKKKI